MKLGELTLRHINTICVETKCMDCPLFCPNMHGIGDISSYQVCVKSLGMNHLMEVLDIEIPELDDK